MEIENSMMRCEASRVSNLKSLVPRNGNGSSMLRCEELQSSEKIEPEALGLQNDDVTQSGEKQIDENNMSKPNAESCCEGREESHVYDVAVTKHRESESEIRKYSAMNISSGSLHLSSGGENVEEVNGWGCAEERPSQHGSSSQDHLDMSKEPFADWVSDYGGDSLGNSEDSDCSADSKNSLGDLMDMLAMKYRNRNDGKEMKWKSEPELLSSFEENPELCMKAVCALYRQEISEDEISPKGLHFDSDTLRVGWNKKV
ncbi:uncharacterized protein LOC113320924 isoform X2 [Papaver somniferum]|uniref:uncharacterized protein LOC113320924 isoform X2 n=1 Tax=Papaver somniferum TaxID=3469 RepID=UPI000E6FBFA3|nr:uncharacterized protein LOC113320924 isoform X2 [Papaver somniferum]